jgi:hypothetical protein
VDTKRVETAGDPPEACIAAGSSPTNSISRTRPNDPYIACAFGILCIAMLPIDNRIKLFVGFHGWLPPLRYGGVL